MLGDLWLFLVNFSSLDTEFSLVMVALNCAQYWSCENDQCCCSVPKIVAVFEEHTVIKVKLFLFVIFLFWILFCFGAVVVSSPKTLKDSIFCVIYQCAGKEGFLKSKTWG